MANLAQTPSKTPDQLGAVTSTEPVRRHYGRRARATQWRLELVEQLKDGTILDIDFEGIDATQSFMDELIGVIVLERGPGVLKQLRFRHCSADLKAIIQFVVADRAAQFQAAEATGRRHSL